MQLVCDIIKLTWKIRSFKLSIEIALFLQLALGYHKAFVGTIESYLKEPNFPEIRNC